MQGHPSRSAAPEELQPDQYTLRNSLTTSTIRLMAESATQTESMVKAINAICSGSSSQRPQSPALVAQKRRHRCALARVHAFFRHCKYYRYDQRRSVGSKRGQNADLRPYQCLHGENISLDGCVTIVHLFSCFATALCGINDTIDTCLSRWVAIAPADRVMQNTVQLRRNVHYNVLELSTRTTCNSTTTTTLNATSTSSCS